MALGPARIPAFVRRAGPGRLLAWKGASQCRRGGGPAGHRRGEL